MSKELASFSKAEALRLARRMLILWLHTSGVIGVGLAQSADGISLLLRATKNSTSLHFPAELEPYITKVEYFPGK